MTEQMSPGGRPPDPREMWSYTEVAAHIGVKRNTVRSYRKAALMPPPDLVEGGRPYWRAATIRDWAARRPGNNRKRRSQA